MIIHASTKIYFIVFISIVIGRKQNFFNRNIIIIQEKDYDYKKNEN